MKECVNKAKSMIKTKKDAEIKASPILNFYPDSMGGTLRSAVKLLERPELTSAFSDVYILPSLYHSDLDRGFCVIDYDLNETLATEADLERLRDLQITLLLDMVMNHASAQSKEFQDILHRGRDSVYMEFFLDWNRFWKGRGTNGAEGYVIPEKSYLKDMFFRQPGLPVLVVITQTGERIPFWNTFYQKRFCAGTQSAELAERLGLAADEAERLSDEIRHGLATQHSPEQLALTGYSVRRDIILALLYQNMQYLGQIDLNVESQMVWSFYEQTIQKLADYGAEIVRLDAFAYTSKVPGKRNFFNEPETWEILDRMRRLAEVRGISLLPEIHASYAEKIHEKISEKGFLTYDFFLPGLLLDAMECADPSVLRDWALEVYQKKIRTVNMLGCHDGIPLLDLKGLLPEERIDALIDRVLQRGGKIKDLHGAKNVYYQINATYFSALGEEPKRLVFARAVQLFMPGKPQVWYLDLFAGKNDLEAVKRAGADGHKEINRTNLTEVKIQEALETHVVQRQLALLRFRNNFPAFGFDAEFRIEQIRTALLRFVWEKNGCAAILEADFKNASFRIGARPCGEAFAWTAL